jgi:hypothetical protein
MKLFSQLLVLGLAAEGAVASNWFSKAGMSSISHPWPTASRLVFELLENFISISLVDVVVLPCPPS